MVRLSLPARLVPPLAAVKLTLGLVAFCATYTSFAGRDPAFAYANYGLFATVFGATGALLLLGGREDRRALALGGFFLAIATSWSDRPLHNLWQSDPSSYGLLALADALEVSVFVPYFIWVFVREFPSPPPDRRRYQLMVRGSAVVGLALFAVNLLKYGLQGLPEAAQRLAIFTPEAHQEIFYDFVDLVTAAALLVLPWKARQAQGPERRRARVFLQLLALMFGPGFGFLVIYLVIPGVKPFFDARPHLLFWISIVCLAPALALPVAIPYAVLVQRVLDVRLIARRALQYALARSAVTGLVAVPTVALALYVAAHSDRSVANLFSGSRVPLLIAAILVGAAALRYRKPLLEAIDRRFFREQYDARHILGLLVERIRPIRDSANLAALVTREIDLALHLERTALLALDPRSGVLLDPRNRTRRLDFSSSLALTLSNASDPLEVDLGNVHSPLLKLPERDRRWLADSGFRLLVPILARDGSLLGVLALGEKKSGLPFLKEDRELLHAIASSAAWVLELEIEQSLASSQSSQSWQGRMEPDDPTPRELLLPLPTESAKECPSCGAIHAAYTVFCGNCSKKLEPSLVPYVLPGKFRFERRLGAGGMGVVYCGFDLALGRRTAIKTLRHVSPEDVLRLLKEARTAALVSHPHLAPVYSMETWQGTPLLIMELLEGGTLAQRLLRETLSPRETVELGIAMAGALSQLHAARILHRDVKPSNIGYTRDRVPKLMDFGIARVGGGLDEEDDEVLDGEEDDTALAPLSPWSQEDESRPTVRFRFAGTLSYLSPEAARGEPADHASDLWGLAIVLYECLLGKKIFAGPQQQVLPRIRSGLVPDFSQVLPEHDGILGDFFRAALHRSPARRPATADEMRRRLEEVRLRTS
ncbi:MAG TPA: protein kinase [Thermoanaerobaculia bacterium]|nr:protein kinase [Thermoanaerobaculia bacterium]